MYTQASAFSCISVKSELTDSEYTGLLVPDRSENVTIIGGVVLLDDLSDPEVLPPNKLERSAQLSLSANLALHKPSKRDFVRDMFLSVLFYGKDEYAGEPIQHCFILEA